MKLLATGFSKHQGNYEGVDYDYVKIYLLAKLQQTPERSGSAGIDMRASPQVFDQVNKIDFKSPVYLEVESEMIALGGGNARETITSVKPIKGL